MTKYFALIRKESGSDYGVDFPDFPGCIKAGISLDDARIMASKALGLHISGLQKDLEPIPDPSTWESVMLDPKNRDAVAVLIGV